MIPENIKDNNNEVIVSSVEPTNRDRKKVWLQHGKNLFNSETERVGYWVSNGVETANAVWNISAFIEVIPSTEYVLSSSYISGQSSSAQCEIIEYDITQNYISRYFQEGPIRAARLSNITKYVKIAYRNDKQTNIQFEQGNTPTTYEPYIKDKTFTLNDNDVYEEFNNSIIESGSNSYGRYTKFIDGTMICRGYIAANVTLNDWTAEGNIYRAKIVPENNKPFAASFIDTPTITATMTSDSPMWGFLGTIMLDKDRITYGYLYRGNTAAGRVFWNYIAIGRWK